MSLIFIPALSLLFSFFRRLFAILLEKYFSVSSRQEEFSEKDVLSKISQNSSESSCIRVFSFSKVSGYRLAALLEKDSSTGVFLSIFKNLENTYFGERLLT